MQNPQTLHTYQKMHNKCKKNAKGLRPFKRPEPKNLRHKRHNKCKTNAKGLRPFKRSEPKNLQHKGHNKCKTIAKGLRPFKRTEPKNLRHKGHNKCKTNAKGLRPFKRSEPKISSEESKDGCQKGGRHFSIWTLGTNHSIYPKQIQERTKPFETTARKKGGRCFSENTKFAHIASLINKSSIEVPQKGGKPPFFINCLPGDDSLGKGETFFQQQTQP